MSFLLIPFTLCFWERGNTYMLFIYGLTVLLQPCLSQRIRQAFGHRYLAAFLLLYGLVAISLLWSEDLERGMFILEKKAALFALPVLIALDRGLNPRLIQAALLSLVAGCVCALWAVLAFAAWQYAATGDVSVFFYHRLGWPLDEFNAIYFSFYVFISLIFFDYLIREDAFHRLRSSTMKGLVGGTLILGILLLSSRLFIALLFIYGAVRLVSYWRGRVTPLSDSRVWEGAVLLISFSLLAFGLSRERFQELRGSRFEVLQQEQFRWDTHFTGLTLRLLLLKFGWQALQENRAVVQGLGVGDVRGEINGLVLRYNLYHGNPELGDTGYLNYSLHDQYMETWLQAGLSALVAWLWLLAYGWKKGMKAGWRSPLLWFVMAITALSFFESILERQRGLVFIAFFLSILFINTTDEDSEIPPTRVVAWLG